MASDRIIMNPVRPGGGIGVGGGRKPTTTKGHLPSAKTLKSVLGAWAFQSPNHQIPWKQTRPAGAVAGKIVIQKPAKERFGEQITAYVLKSDPTRAYFESHWVNYKPAKPRPGVIMNPPAPSLFKPKYFGPVSTSTLPK